MTYRFFADVVVVVHLAFVVFVMLGGLFAFRWRWVPWLHLPALAWGACLEFFGWGCPLTPLEKWLRRLGGEAGYEGGFIAHYLLPLLYPAGLTREGQIVLGALVCGVNILAYLLLWRARRR